MHYVRLCRQMPAVGSAVGRLPRREEVENQTNGTAG